VDAYELGGLELGEMALNAQDAQAQAEASLLALEGAHDAGPLEELGGSVVGDVALGSVGLLGRP
jgi:hypothetical protein